MKTEENEKEGQLSADEVSARNMATELLIKGTKSDHARSVGM